MSNFKRFLPKGRHGADEPGGIRAGGFHGFRPANDNNSGSQMPFRSSAPPALEFREAEPMADMQPLQPMTDKRLYSTYRRIRGSLDASFVNGTPLINCGGKAFTINDIVAIAVASGTNMYLVGSRGTGKTLLAETMRRSIFGDRGFYLRGDPDLRLKDLYTSLNLNGKTDEEIYRISRATELCFALMDEMNRIPGLLQGQFLHLFDGYIEIRGVKYPLGTGNYMLAVGTGNPPVNGDYTGTFEEDIALLDRIPLIINVDEVEHAKGDIASIMLADADKSSIPVCDMTPDVLAAHAYLRQKRTQDTETAATIALFSEFAYDQLRYVSIGGKRVDKAQEHSWRDKLSGEHDAGKMMSFASDVSVRTLKHAVRMACSIFQIAQIESELKISHGVRVNPVEFSDFLSAFLDSLKLSLTYDRRFIPADLPGQLDKTHAEMLDAVFADLASAMDTNSFYQTSMILEDFLKSFDNGDFAKAQNTKNQVAKQLKSGANPPLQAAFGIMESKLRNKEKADMDALLERALSDAA